MISGTIQTLETATWKHAGNLLGNHQSPGVIFVNLQAIRLQYYKSYILSRLFPGNFPKTFKTSFWWSTYEGLLL